MRIHSWRFTERRAAVWDELLTIVIPSIAVAKHNLAGILLSQMSASSLFFQRRSDAWQNATTHLTMEKESCDLGPGGYRAGRDISSSLLAFSLVKMLGDNATQSRANSRR